MALNDNTDRLDSEAPRGISRRSIAKAAAWSVPVLAVAVAAPLASASTGPVNVGDFHIDGTCGVAGLGLIGTGFTLTAGAVDLPVGTVIKFIRTSGIANIAALTWSGNALDIQVADSGHATAVLSSPLPANTTVNFTNLLDIPILFVGLGAVFLPPGYAAGGGAKAQGTLDDSFAALCSAN